MTERRVFRDEYDVRVKKESKDSDKWIGGIFYKHITTEAEISYIPSAQHSGFKTRKKAVEWAYSVLDDWQYKENQKTEWEDA